MDFLDPKKRKAHRRRLYLGYALMALLVIGVTILMVFQAYGYHYSLKTGDITQDGLVFVDAQPQAAEVFVNGQHKGSTDQRLVMRSGDYVIELKRDGYMDWRREFTLEGGRIERLVYPFLFPEKLVTDSLNLYGRRPAFATQSPDRRWLLVQRPGSLTDFDLFDLNADTPVASTVSLPPALLTRTGNKHTLSLVEWSTDNSHVVLRHSFSGGSEFLLVDAREPEESVNLTRRFERSFSDLTLRDKRFDRYYLYDGARDIVFNAALQSGQTTTLLRNVLQFHPHGDDTLLYITPSSSDKKKVVATVLQDGQRFDIKEFPAGDKYLLDMASYEGKWFVVAGAVKENKVYVMRDPMSVLRQVPKARLIPAGILRLEGLEYVSFSNNAQFIAVQARGRFVVYDADSDRIYRYDTGLGLPKGRKATWMDGHRLAVSHDGKIQVFDYDGINLRTLSASHPQAAPYFNSGYSRLYTLAPAPNLDGRSALLRTRLIAEAQ